MEKAAMYCRVSTDVQEEKGTSLQTQQEACLAYCKQKNYDVTHTFIETYSGLALERPELNELRELVRGNQVDVVIAYCLDRLSRDPTHGVILTLELEKHGVKLECVSEDVDTSELGKLINYIRGFASKLEAEKIKERTQRGRRARALAGRFPSGSGQKLFGYDYLKGKGTGEGVRYINETEANYVRMMFDWLNEGMSVNDITRQLRALDVPTPAGGKYWVRQVVYRILSNHAYIGKTHVFTKRNGVALPKEEWVEIPNATPAIISEDTFNQAQSILKRNKALASRNAKREYLLSGYLFCGKCGKRYQGFIKKWTAKGKKYEYRYYRCGNSRSIANPTRCYNNQISASTIEPAIWHEIKEALAHPETVIVGLENNRADTGNLEKELQTIIAQLANREKQRDRIHKAFYVTGNEAKFRQDISALHNEIKILTDRQAELESTVRASLSVDTDIEAVKQACQLVRDNLNGPTYEERRFVLEALKVRVTIDGNTVRLEGHLPVNIVKPLSKRGFTPLKHPSRTTG